MTSHILRAARPRRLIVITALLSALMFGLAMRALTGTGTLPDVTRAPVWFDAALGVVSGGGLLYVAGRLWHAHRRDAAALRLALMAWAALVVGLALRAGLFARADYDRGRLPFLLLVGAVLIAAGGASSLITRRNEKNRARAYRNGSAGL